MTTSIIKKILATKYGYKNVSVKRGRGTAHTWVEILIKVKNPCSKPVEQACWDCGKCEVTNCSLENRSWRGSARQLLTTKTAQEARELLKNIQFSTYTVGGGYNTENDCVNIQIDFNEQGVL